MARDPDFLIKIFLFSALTHCFINIIPRRPKLSNSSMLGFVGFIGE